MGFYDAFFGSDQSLYTAYAIIAAIISICVTILFTSTDIPIGSRLLMILFVVITLVPSIFLTLFEITCIVTGGTEPNNWWCYTFAWVLAAFIIIYCIFVVIISIISLVTYNKAIDSVNNDEEKNKVNPNDANNIAKQIMATQQPTQKPIEKFYGGDGDNMNIADLIQGGSINLLNGLGSAANIDPSTFFSDKNKNVANFTDGSYNNAPTAHDTNDHPLQSVKATFDGSMHHEQQHVNETNTKKGGDVAPFTDSGRHVAYFTDSNNQISDNSLLGSADYNLSSYPDIFNSK